MKPSKASLDWLRELQLLVKRCPRGYWLFTGDNNQISLLKLGLDGKPKFNRNGCVDQSMIVGGAGAREDGTPWIDAGAF